MKLKDQRDDGDLTQAEFDARKQQLLREALSVRHRAGRG
jgi:hypothetical protein